MVRELLGDLDDRETIADLDGADEIAGDAGLVRNGAHEILRANARIPSGADEDLRHLATSADFIGRANLLLRCDRR